MVTVGTLPCHLCLVICFYYLWSYVFFRFRRLAVKLFPGEQRMMCLVAEAYEVLADPSSRALFDQLGEEALKAGVVAKPYVFHGQPLKTLE